MVTQPGIGRAGNKNTGLLAALHLPLAGPVPGAAGSQLQRPLLLREGRWPGLWKESLFIEPAPHGVFLPAAPGDLFFYTAVVLPQPEC